MSQTVADEIVATLSKAGVQRIYGIVGDSLNPVTAALSRQKEIDWIHVRHEEAAAFAAGAEAQLTGNLTVCAGSCGPGNLHLINGLFDAHRSMAPVLAIASHIPTTEIGTGYFQETHPDQLFRECSHYCELVTNPRQLTRVLQSAIQHAISQRGVSVIVLPGDVAGMAAVSSPLAHNVALAPSIVRPIDAELVQLANIVNSAPKITLFCGSGCADAHDEVLALAEMLKAPVGYAFRGKEWIEFDNPFAVGMSGLLGWGAAYEAMHGCDALLLLGTDFPYENFIPTKSKIIQIDLRAERLGRRSRLDLGLCGDIRETIKALLPLLTAKSDRTFLDGMLEKHRYAAEKIRKNLDNVQTRRPIHPGFVAATVDELAGPDAIFAADTGMSCVWAARYLSAGKNRRLLGSFTHGSMANALPQAIGAQATYPDRTVITFSGDGGFAMLMGEILTLAQHDLPVKIVLFNNSSLGMVHLEMEVAGLAPFGCHLKNPNFAALAQAMGMFGVRVEDPSELRSALQQAFVHRGPALVDIVTDPNVLAMPPRATVQQAMGFALAMTKVAFSGDVHEVMDTVAANWK
ncbi:ubiquinone-dependent pyruvate dehydrogenase [Schlesneria paludicola]|uniref:ubiquinone-dependent pyruvate dehydrogenase n=1 Tax=Schlesneria paludicola TaxID=360056 RepID=UPI00029ACEF7|nr:ubiquinone-dependent pyruvate dehydrogenase [Schlesneria paludicola]